MIYVAQVSNPFNPSANTTLSQHADGLSVQEILREIYGPDFVDFEFPTVCQVNGTFWLRAEWGCVPPAGAQVSFIRMAEGVTEIVIALVVLIVAAVVVALVIAPAVPPQNPAAIGAADKNGEQKNGDTVYSLAGQKNQVRLNSAIESSYGLNRLWPSYAALPYSVYEDNRQFQYALFCLGHGQFSIKEMRFEDTPIQNFEEVEFEIVKPGEDFELFADNVVTSSGVSGIELFGPNEDDFNGPSNAIVVNPPFTKVRAIEVDVSFPSGLYKLNVLNQLEKERINVLFQYQRLNDAGAAIGDWEPLIFQNKSPLPTVPGEDGYNATKYAITYFTYFQKEMATLTPQRFTLRAKVVPGRYQVRAQRINPKNEATTSSNVVQWDELRAYFPSVKNYGDVTLVAVKSLATNNLNNNTASRFNVVATRKLPIWTQSGGWSVPTKTRNPVWAFCDVFRARYGGRLATQFLNMTELRQLADTYSDQNYTFDYVFDQPTTVWEAARSIARAGRGIPMLSGSQITIIRDRLRTAATAVFNQHNIIRDSLDWSVKLRNTQDHDGVEVQYVDEDTFEPETVLCLVGDKDLGDNPEIVKLSGVTSRRQAFQEGLYLRATQLYNREQITFKTGLEGYLPQYGDLILVSHDVPRWGTGGRVMSIDGTTIQLSDPVIFLPGVEHRLILRNKDGTAYGPLPVTLGADSRTVEVANPVDAGDFFFDTVHEPPYYLFGQENLESKRCTVVGITPQSDDVVEIKCVSYDERVYSFGAVPTPAKYAPATPVVYPTRPVIKRLHVSFDPDSTNFLQLSWSPALGAKSYVIDQSSDNVHWTRAATTTTTVYSLRVRPGFLWLRVAGVNSERGPWVSWSGAVGDVTEVPGTVLNLRVINSVPGSVTVGWDSLAGADSYDLSIFDKATSMRLRLQSVDGLRYTYTLDMGDADGLTGRKVTFKIKGRNIVGTSAVGTSLLVTILERAVVPTDYTADKDTFTTDSETTFTDHA